MNRFEAWHVDRVRQLPCVICAHKLEVWTPCQEAHHIKEGVGLSQRASHFLTIPFCYEHHQGASGLHGLGTRGFYTRWKLDELDCLALTLEMLARLSLGASAVHGLRE